MLRNSRQPTPTLYQHKPMLRSIFHQHIVRIVDIQPRPILRNSVSLHLPQRVPHKDSLPKYRYEDRQQQRPDNKNLPQLFLLLVILLFRIDPPQRSLIDVPLDKPIHYRHRSQHAVVLVVVLMHPVSPH